MTQLDAKALHTLKDTLQTSLRLIDLLLTGTNPEPKEFKIPPKPKFRFKSTDQVNDYIVNMGPSDRIQDHFLLDSKANKANLDKVEDLAAKGMMASIFGGDKELRKEMNEFLFSIQRPIKEH